MLGFHFPENFRHPYTARSVTDFWRRWHITMSEWFKSYVYFPLGGSRCAAWKKYRNIFIVWMLTGLWHGASWNFVLWGLYFGVLLILERLFLQKFLDKLPRVLQTAYTMLLVVFGWVLFEMTDLSGIGQYFGAMFGAFGGGVADRYAVFTMINNLVLFILCAVGATTLSDHVVLYFSRKCHKATAIALPIVQVGLLLVCIAFLVNASYNPFLYFNF
jgi:alginate O-acetyltransferase complex protein AlgI